MLGVCVAVAALAFGGTDEVRAEKSSWRATGTRRLRSPSRLRGKAAIFRRHPERQLSAPLLSEHGDGHPASSSAVGGGATGEKIGSGDRGGHGSAIGADAAPPSSPPEDVPPRPDDGEERFLTGPEFGAWASALRDRGVKIVHERDEVVYGATWGELPVIGGLNLLYFRSGKAASERIETRVGWVLSLSRALLAEKRTYADDATIRQSMHWLPRNTAMTPALGERLQELAGAMDTQSIELARREGAVLFRLGLPTRLAAEAIAREMEPRLISTEQHAALPRAAQRAQGLLEAMLRRPEGTKPYLRDDLFDAVATLDPADPDLKQDGLALTVPDPLFAAATEMFAAHNYALLPKDASVLLIDTMAKQKGVLGAVMMDAVHVARFRRQHAHLDPALTRSPHFAHPPWDAEQRIGGIVAFSAGIPRYQDLLGAIASFY